MAAGFAQSSWAAGEVWLFAHNLGVADELWLRSHNFYGLQKSYGCGRTHNMGYRGIIAAGFARFFWIAEGYMAAGSQSSIGVR